MTSGFASAKGLVGTLYILATAASLPACTRSQKGALEPVSGASVPLAAASNTDAANAQAPGSKTTVRAEREPGAIAALERMGAFLRSLSTFAVRGDSTTDEILDTGQKIQLSRSVQLWVRRPDGLRAKLDSDRKEREFFYDGKTFTLYAPQMGYYAQFTAPNELRALVELAEQRYGLELPLVDLFYWGTERSPVSEISGAIDLGPSRVGEVETEHYAFRKADVDFQLWLQRGEQPLPRKLVITTTQEPSQPQHAVTLSWNLQAILTDRDFAFVAPAGANRITFEVRAP